MCLVNCRNGVRPDLTHEKHKTSKFYGPSLRSISPRIVKVLEHHLELMKQGGDTFDFVEDFMYDIFEYLQTITRKKQDLEWVEPRPLVIKRPRCSNAPRSKTV